MKSLRSLTIVFLGPAILAVASTALVGVFRPDMRTFSGLGLGFLLGAALGLVLFGPIATGVAIRNRHPEWLNRYSIHINWYTSLVMLFSLGYLTALRRHHVSDSFGAAAFLAVFLGAAVKVALLADAKKQKRQDAV
jgi:uncharacterized BrkB/YihY/UPF0761 family membrane protein